MAGRIPQHFIDELVARTDIIEVIGSRVQFKRAGREYKARCPFHDEKTPSFTVSPDKQFYHCFGCAHGTALGFVMEFDHLGFVEAVEELAARAGLEVLREGGDTAPRPNEDLYVALERAALFFRQSLSGEPRARVPRGSRADQRQPRHASASDTRRRAERAARPLRDDPGRAADARTRGALVIERTDGGTGQYDRFRDRVMFPIRDVRGRTIGPWRPRPRQG